ncbi:MAG: carbohydrate kinase family protein [Candidatus Helarchaeota archaeon]|nr:carbohydrate kinase family protein [Candidatus Helarchaeota archaeon]
MSEEIDVACIGSACIDVIIGVSDVMRLQTFDQGFIKKYTAIEYSTKLNVEELHFVTGGSAANISVDLRYLNMKTAYIGKLGDDFLGRECVKDLKDNNVNTDSVYFDKSTSTGLSVILLTPWGKDRSILSYKGANNLITPAELNVDIIKKSRALVWTSLTSETATATIQRCIDLMKDKKSPIFAAPSMSILSKKLDSAVEFVKQSDVLSLNKEEITELTGESNLENAFEKVLSWGIKLVACTDGRNGSQITDGTNIITAPIYKIDAKDTTGAGDAFMAGLIYSKLNNFSLVETTKFATAFSAFECMVLGVREGFPSKVEDIFQFVEKNELALKERPF